LAFLFDSDKHEVYSEVVCITEVHEAAVILKNRDPTGNVSAGDIRMTGHMRKSIQALANGFQDHGRHGNASGTTKDMTRKAVGNPGILITFSWRTNPTKREDISAVARN
jgi:hypothetical protein